MKRSVAVQLIALVATAGLIGGASTFVQPINQSRDNLNIYGAAEDLRNAPPEYAFAIQALGAFRSLIVDIAFIRAEQFKQEGRYYDAMQLAEWICKLQPHFPAVWEFHAWNMSWNISVTTYTPEERWHWVYNGVRLLRDEGLPMNPRAVNLYKQLAWTFFNKMGTETDEYHMAYKKAWAYRMHLILGAPPAPEYEQDPDVLLAALELAPDQDRLMQAVRRQQELHERPDENAAETDNLPDPDRLSPLPRSPQTAKETAAVVAVWQRIADAPHSLAALYDAHPEARRLVRELRTLGIFIADDPLTEAEFMAQNGLANTFFQRYRQLEDPSIMSRITRADDATNEQEDLLRLRAILDRPEHPATTDALIAFLQQKVLREAFKNDPDLVRDLVRKYGPIDWRMVDAQAIYWAERGLQASEGTVNVFENDKTNLLRIMLFSLQNLSRSNEMFFDPNHQDAFASYINLMPDPSFIDAMNEAYLKYARLDERSLQGPGAGRLFKSGHINFLAEGIRTLFFAGRQDEAAAYYDYLRETYGYLPSGELEARYQRTLDEYVSATYLENVSLRREAVRHIRGLTLGAIESLAAGDVAKSANLIEQAQNVHAVYMEENENETFTRLRLPPLRAIFTDMFRAYMTLPSVSPMQTVHKVRVWSSTPPEIQLEIYDDVLPTLQAETRRFDIDLAKAFPPPAGLEQWRLENPNRTDDTFRDTEGRTETRPFKTPGG